ncbi:MAG: type II toxin-antitoxin system VapC family toxin [Balneolaceae bacterium]
MIRPVIDACVAIKWFLPEKDHDKAGAILNQYNMMIAPDLFLIELDAIITKKVRQKLVEPEEAIQIYSEIRNIPFEFIPYNLISKLALDLSIALPVTQYDACYLATAIEYNQKLYTADKRFIRGMKKTPFERYLSPIG